MVDWGEKRRSQVNKTSYGNSGKQDNSKVAFGKKLSLGSSFVNGCTRQEYLFCRQRMVGGIFILCQCLLLSD